MASWGSRKTLRPSSGVGGSLLCSAFNFSTCKKKRKELSSKISMEAHSDYNDVITVVSLRSELNLSSQVAAALRNAS